MCSLQQLYFGDEGYVVRCSACLHYQLGFGTSLLTLSDIELQCFRAIIGEKLIDADSMIHDETRCVWLPASADGFAMLLTFRELKTLAVMLDKADTEERVLALMQCFERE